VSADVDTLRARLASTEPGARRIAILDLIASARHDERAIPALLDHLPRETDERAALLVIRHLGAAAGTGALRPLWALYARRETPVRIAHAAIIEHDRILARQPRDSQQIQGPA
jgi:hypothetical protein